jgi:hypothetical protein
MRKTTPAYATFGVCECCGDVIRLLRTTKRFCSRCADARGKYRSQKVAAVRRGIPFLLTFNEWWRIWQGSGHWHERGCHCDQYQMARNGDCGPYAVGNVQITTAKDNHAEAHVGKKHSPEKKRKARETRRNRPLLRNNTSAHTGIRKHGKGFEVRIVNNEGNTVSRSFPTLQEAVAARKMMEREYDYNNRAPQE